MAESEPKPRLIELVAPGAGQGWKAVLKNGKPAVVHEIPVPPAEAAAAIPRIQRLAEHRHPALSPVLAWGTDPNGIWVAVEPNEGTPLATMLSRGPLTPPAAAALGAAVLSGVAALHEAGIAMGGFGASAIRITGNGEVRLAGHPAAAVRGAPAQSDLRADVRSCGMAVCAAFGVDPAGAPAPPNIPPGLVVTMRSMASGAMGPAADRPQGALREMARLCSPRIARSPPRPSWPRGRAGARLRTSQPSCPRRPPRQPPRLSCRPRLARRRRSGHRSPTTRRRGRCRPIRPSRSQRTPRRRTAGASRARGAPQSLGPSRPGPKPRPNEPCSRTRPRQHRLPRSRRLLPIPTIPPAILPTTTNPPAPAHETFPPHPSPYRPPLETDPRSNRWRLPHPWAPTRPRPRHAGTLRCHALRRRRPPHLPRSKPLPKRRRGPR